MHHPTIVAFTGHRPDKLGGYRRNPLTDTVAVALRDRLRLWAPAEVISGMALGFDQLAARVAIRMGIPVRAAVPFEGFDARWPRQSRAQLERLLRACSRVVVVTTETRAPTETHSFHQAAQMLHARNRYMVDQSTHLVALWDGSPGGTASCLKYADGKYDSGHYTNLWSEALDTLREEVTRKPSGI